MILNSRFLTTAFILLGSVWTVFAQLPTEPLQGYVTVEAFEVRKEFAVYLRALPEWKADAEAGEVVTMDEREAILADLQEIFAAACPMTIEGETVEFELDRLQFVRVFEEQGVLPDDREEIPVSEALVAAVFATVREGFPERLTIEWTLFPGEIEEVPLHFSSQGVRESRTATKKQPTHLWIVPKREAEPELLEVPAPPEPAMLRLPVVGLALLGVAVLIGLISRIGSAMRKPAVGLVAGLCLVGGLVFWNVGGLKVRDPFAEKATLAEPEARDVVNALLLNLYHAFDYRQESKIYDTLAATVEGDLLEEIYLEIRRGLELEDQGGPRVKVDNVDLRECFPETLGERAGFRADTEWVALGTVTHWGHTHQRLNLYRAWLEIEPVEGEWKITGIDIIEEGRM